MGCIFPNFLFLFIYFFREILFRGTSKEPQLRWAWLWLSISASVSGHWNQSWWVWWSSSPLQQQSADCRRPPKQTNLLKAVRRSVSEVTVTHVPLVCVWAEWRGGVLTIRKQLRTLGSTLLPPNAATSPSCRGIWMASWSSRLRWRWSVKPPAPDTCRNKSATTRSSRQHRFFSICSCYLYCVLSTVVNSSTRMCVRIKSSCFEWRQAQDFFPSQEHW